MSPKGPSTSQSRTHFIGAFGDILLERQLAHRPHGKDSASHDSLDEQLQGKVLTNHFSVTLPEQVLYHHSIKQVRRNATARQKSVLMEGLVVSCLDLSPNTTIDVSNNCTEGESDRLEFELSHVREDTDAGYGAAEPVHHHLAHTTHALNFTMT